MFSKFVAPSGIEWVFILLMGVAGLYFQVFMTKAYAAGKKAGIIATVGYADVIFTIAIGTAMGDALPNAAAFFGIFLVIFSGIIVVKER